jgi:hypothetical protein
LVDPSALGSKAFAAVQTLAQTPAGTTELAAAAAAALPNAGNDWRGLVKTLRSKLPTSPQRSVVLYEPVDNPALAGAATPAAGPDRTRATMDATTPGMADTRRVQLALQRLGYYAGKIDGVVGADTVAAVRRFQNELRAEMTGQLSKDQTERLLKDGK